MAVGPFGRYQILEEIGLGGMSKVYRAHDPRRRRDVAVKALPPESMNDLGFRARFEREAQLVMALVHKAIVPVYEYSALQGQPYIVMQYMPNGSLAARLVHGPLAPAETAAVLERIGSALDYAHAQGIIHRDIKPSNVLFDRGGKAYLADFGIALQPHSSGEGNLAISGTPGYMSPEQLLREEVDERSDIYSLGIIAFEMLSGRLPFGGDSPMGVALKQIYDPTPRLWTTQEEPYPALESVVLRALSKDAQERYGTAADFVKAFRLALQPDQGTAQATSSSPVAQKEEGALSGTRSSHQPPSSPEIVLPDEMTHALVLPEIVASHKGRRALPIEIGWKGRHILAMALITWLGVLLAAVGVALARGETVVANAKVQMVYNQDGAAVINISGRPLDLSTLTFQRVSESGEVTASFPAIQWFKIGARPAKLLLAGACYQLLPPDTVSLSFTPGEAPLKPDGCQASQGWLLALNPEWQFWQAQGTSQTIRVLYGQQVIQTCPIAAGSCQFTLPEP